MHDDILTLIIDPFALFREGLRLLLVEANFNPVWCSNVPPDASQVPALGDGTPVLIIGSEVEVAGAHIAAVKRIFPDLRVVLLVEAPTPERLVEALCCGADTLVPRHSSTESLIYTLRLVRDGAAVFPSDMMRAIGAMAARRSADAAAGNWQDAGPMPALPQEDDSPRMSHVFGLSDRELSVLMWLRDGLPNKEIARRMDISEATVKVHVKAILRKARMRNRTQVASWASRYSFANHAPLAVLPAAQ